MAIDSAGKFLFVATAPASATYTIDLDTTPISTVATLDSVGVAVYAIGANASLTKVAGSPFSLPAEPGGGGSPSPSALAVTPTVYPVQFAACSGHAAPTTENLYVADSINNVLLNYKVDVSAGTLTPVPFSTATAGIATGTLPSGVAVDPCNRFVYISNATSNSVSAFTICSVVSQSCQQPDFSLQPVGSPIAVSPGDGPGPLAVDPYGNFLYVVDNGSSQLSAFRISSSSGGLTSVGTYPTNSDPNSIAIRSDDSWIFVADFSSATVSQYAITPATGGLTPQAPFGTLNNPSGVAVK